MADSKLTALTADTAPASTDITYTIDDTAGTPVSKKVTWANVATALAGMSPFGTAAQKTLIDDDTFATATSTNIPSAESVKAYVDASAAGGAVLVADTSTAGFGFVVDEDDMVSNSATKLPSQQSVKAYVDALATLTTSDTTKVPISTSGGVTTLDVSLLLDSTTTAFTDSAFRVQDVGDATKQIAFDAANSTATTLTLASSNTTDLTITFPNIAGTVCLTSGTQTLTGKTLTAPTLTSSVSSIMTLGAARTLTSNEVYSQLQNTNTVTVNFASGSVPAALGWSGVNQYMQAGIASLANRFCYAAATIQNEAGSAVGIGGSRIFDDSNTVTADTQVGLAAGTYMSYRAGVTYGVTSTGTWTSGAYFGYVATPAIGTGTTLSGATMFGGGTPTVAGTVTTFTWMTINNPTVTGTVTTLYGINIAALTGGGTNVGIRNASSTQLGSAQQLTVDTSGNLATTGTIGYGTGAGGTVTQATSKSTGVTLSKSSGAITMNAAALAAGTIVSFVLTNTVIAATDVLILNHISGGTVGSYTLNAQCAAGTATINVRNNTAGSLSEAVVIQFAIVKAVNA